MAARRTEKQNMIRDYENEQKEKEFQEEFERRQEVEAAEAEDLYNSYKRQQEEEKKENHLLSTGIIEIAGRKHAKKITCRKKNKGRR